MAEIVNLRLARKRKARADREQAADENRARHGRTGAERNLDQARRKQDAAFLDAHRRDKSDGEDRE